MGRISICEKKIGNTRHMLSYTKIGSNGRLGNQMFQFAALYGTAYHKSLSIHFSKGRLYEAFKMTGVAREESCKPTFLYQESKFSFCSDILSISDNTELDGYFQTSRYWDHVSDRIVAAFEFRDCHIDTIPADIKDNCQSSTSVHIRKTDYTSSNGYHPVVDERYILESLKVIQGIDASCRSLSIFTDDVQSISHTVELIERSGFECSIIGKSQLTDIQELYLMSLCKNAVIANSSFSWWGAYLGPHQSGGIVVAPKKWFGEKGPKDTQDIYQKSWIVL